MADTSNALAWDGRGGHYEVYYLTLTDARTGVGCWIRYTLLAPTAQQGGAPTAALWFLAMDPRPDHPATFARKTVFPIDQLSAQEEPFELRIADAVLTQERMSGQLPDAAWDLRFRPSAHSYTHVHPVLRMAGAAQTFLTLPQANLLVEGRVTFGGEEIELSGVHGAQAHLYGSKHARTWAWVHAGDFIDEDRRPVPGTVIDAVSVVVNRFGRDVGPSTPVVGRIEDEDFISTSPIRVLTNPSTFALTGWHFEAVAGKRKLIAEVDARRSQLAGVAYEDPDGEGAYCYNTETATLRLQLLHRARHVGGWALRRRFQAPGRAHFEYAQRTPVPGMPVLLP